MITNRKITKNIAIFYTARSGSSRLKNKMMKKVSGKTVIELGLERLLLYGKVRPILCTTSLSEDDKLAKIASKMGVDFYRGVAEDVLERYLGAASQYGIDFFIQVDGDDLFVDHIYLDRILDEYKKHSPDYIYCKGLPYGTYASGVKTKALERLCRIKDESDTQWWGRYFVDTGLFKSKTVDALPQHAHLEFRLTLDYPEDLSLIRKVYKSLYRPGKYLSLDEVMEFLDKNPKIAQSNWNRKDEYAKRLKTKYSKIKLKKH